MDPQQSEATFQQAGQLFQQGQYEQALNLLGQLNQAHPNSAKILMPAVQCMEKLGRTQEALPLCQQLIQLQHPQGQALYQHLSGQGTPPPIPQENAGGIPGMGGLNSLDLGDMGDIGGVGGLDLGDISGVGGLDNFDIGGMGKPHTTQISPVASMSAGLEWKAIAICIGFVVGSFLLACVLNKWAYSKVLANRLSTIAFVETKEAEVEAEMNAQIETANELLRELDKMMSDPQGLMAQMMNNPGSVDPAQMMAEMEKSMKTIEDHPELMNPQVAMAEQQKKLQLIETEINARTANEFLAMGLYFLPMLLVISIVPSILGGWCALKVAGALKHDEWWEDTKEITIAVLLYSALTITGIGMLIVPFLLKRRYDLTVGALILVIVLYNVIGGVITQGALVSVRVITAVDFTDLPEVPVFSPETPSLESLEIPDSLMNPSAFMPQSF